jgi:hypothetical protein
MVESYILSITLVLIFKLLSTFNYLNTEVWALTSIWHGSIKDFCVLCGLVYVEALRLADV